ncbi:MAG: hypothetical protein ABI806_05750 [Candidatus Solibacter sp.]
MAYAALLFGATLALQRMSAHSTSRLDTIESMVERSTFAIDGASYQTVDKVFIDGHYYSHQPPLQAMVGAAVYYQLWLAGLRLGPGRVAAYTIVTFAVNGLMTVIGLAFFWRALAWSEVPERWHLAVTASLACGTLLLPFGTTMNGHGFSAALLSMGLYFYVRGGAVFWAGLAFGLAGASDHALLVFFGAFGLSAMARWGKGAVWFFVAGALALAPVGVYYYAVGHSLVPIAARPELFVYSGSVWSADGGIYNRLTGAGWNSGQFAASYGVKLLVGPHGFLIYNPASWLALYGMALVIRRRMRYWIEAAGAAAGSCLVIVYYALASVNSSGWTYSVRWFIPFLPLWWYFGAPVVNGWTQRAPRWAVALCAVSVFYALAGTLNPWSSPYSGYATPWTNIVEEARRPHFGRYIWR